VPEFDFETEFEELNLVELESIKRLVQLLSNTLKSLLIYPHNNPIPKEFKRKLYLSLGEFLDSNDELKLEINPSQLLYEGKLVYEDGEKEEGLAYVLHKDGVRELAFLKGLEQGEIEDFVEVIEACQKSTDLEEDLVTMLWEKDLNHIKYLVVDDLLDVDIPSAEDIPDDWDFDRLFRSEIALSEQNGGPFGADRPDFTQPYRQEQIKELLKKLKEFSPEEVENIQQLLEMDDRHRSFDEFLNILTEILIAEKDFSEFSQMMETVERILGALTNMADFHSAAKIVWGLKRFDKMMQKPSEQIDSLKKNKAERTRQVVDKTGEEENVKRISEVLNEKEITDFSSVREYFFSLNWNSIPPVVHMLRDLKDFPARRMVCEVLTEKGKDHLELLEEGISDSRWYVVRNVVSVLGAIGSEKGIRFLKQIIHHPDLRVRREVVTSLFKIPGSEAGVLLSSFLEDEDKRIRILASRGLAQRKEKEALPAVMNILKDDQFKDKSPEEKKSMLESFSTLAGEEAIPFLVKMVNKRSWLKRDKHNETRIFAIGALSLIDASEAKEALVQLSKKRNKAIQQACQYALHRIDYRQIRRAELSKGT